MLWFSLLTWWCWRSWCCLSQVDFDPSPPWRSWPQTVRPTSHQAVPEVEGSRSPPGCTALPAWCPGLESSQESRWGLQRVRDQYNTPFICFTMNYGGVIITFHLNFLAWFPFHPTSLIPIHLIYNTTLIPIPWSVSLIPIPWSVSLIPRPTHANMSWPY